MRETLIFSLLLVLPLFFGGVNVTATYLAYFLSFSFAAYVLIADNFKLDLFLRFFAVLFLYILVQFVVLSSEGVPHPISGSVSALYDRELFFDTALSLLFFVSVYIVVSNFFVRDSEAGRIIQRIIVISAFLVSLIGLSHWFYDNGKLFWFFEPRYSNISERARWPFVNPNHLGNFLLLSVFLQLSKVSELYSEIRKEGVNLAKFSSTRFHNRIIKLGFSLIVLMSIIICLAATLSRGSWTGFGVGLIFFILGRFVMRKAPEKRSELTVVRNETDGGERKRRKKKGVSDFLSIAIKKLSKPLVFAFGAYLFLFLLNEQGQELVKGRIEYGLKYSLEDMRWTMYEDTLAMIKDRPLFGIGLGQWQKVYPKYMDESLSGINPVYLHSEPLQMISELGLLGASLIIGISVYLLILAFRSLSAMNAGNDKAILGITSGLLAFTVAMFVEFPLRMPAIQALLAVNLALLVNKLREV